MKKMKTLPLLMLMIASLFCTAQKSASFQKNIPVDSDISESFPFQNFSPQWLDPPGSFTAEFIQDNGVFCSWGEQQPNEAWLGYDDGINSNSPGMGGGNYYTAIRFDTSTLINFHNWQLTQFKFFPKKETLDSEIKLIIWEDTNAYFQVYEQVLENLSWNEWNTIELDEIYVLNDSKELWIGFEVTQPNGEDPIGHDAGPAISGYGDMISFDGTTWESLSLAYGLDFNFNLQVFVTEELDEISNNPKSTVLDPTNFQNIHQTRNSKINQENNSNHRAEYLGVNIYRNGDLLNSFPVEPGIMEYLDEFFEPGTYYYTARAVYDEGFSDPTPEVEVNIPGNPEISVSPDSLFEIHDNPPQITTREVTITNTGDEDLFWYLLYGYSGISKSPSNNSELTPIKMKQRDLCIDNLYSNGCTYGDGITYWDLTDVNIPDIPCSGTPEWYHGFWDKVHTMVVGETYDLTVQAGYEDTWFSVWIDLNDNLEFESDELILGEANIPVAGVSESFEISIPMTAPPDLHKLRCRTNWGEPVLDPCETYEYGNCCDFMVFVPGYTEPWFSFEPSNGMLNPGQSEVVTVSFNSNELEPDNYFASIHVLSNDPANPEFNIPVSLEVTQDAEGLLIYETFEDYEANQALVQQALAQGKAYWTTLNNQPGGAEDPMISYDAGVAAKGIVIENGNEAVMQFEDNYTEGLYNIEFSFSENWQSFNSKGIFNILQKFDGENSQPGLQIIFDNFGQASINAGGENAEELQFISYQWHHIRCTIDIDNDLAQLYFDDEFIIEWQWSLGALGNGNLNELSAIHFSGNVTGTAKIYYDHIIVWKGTWPGFSPPQNFQLDYDPGCNSNYFSWTYPDSLNPKIITRTPIGQSVLNTKRLVGFNVDGRDWEYGESWELLAENLQTPGYCAGWPFTDLWVEFYATALYNWDDIIIESARSGSYEEVESIDEIEVSVKISPNPANDYLNIESKHRINRVVIFDINGLEVYSGQASANEILINTNNFKPGIYALQLETEKGISVHKVVVR